MTEAHPAPVRQLHGGWTRAYVAVYALLALLFHALGLAPEPINGIIGTYAPGSDGALLVVANMPGAGNFGGDL